MAINTFTNSRTNETISTEMEAQEVLCIFHRTAGGDNWMWFWLVKHAERMKAQGHPATICDGTCLQGQEEAPRAIQPPAQQDMMAFIGDSFLLALGLGLKRPMIRVHYKGRRYKVYLSTRGTICIKTGALAVKQDSLPGSPVVYTNDPVGDEVYMGCVYKGEFRPGTLGNAWSEGRYDPNAPKRPLSVDEKEFLDRMSKDPVTFLAECSKDMCRCCYCGLPLEDQRSKDVGYGPICAAHWGLPWGKSYDEKVPSFASLWQKSSRDDTNGIKACCAEIKTLRGQRMAITAGHRLPVDQQQKLKDDEAAMWLILGDLLSDLGMKKLPTMPDDKVRMPIL